MSEYVTSKEECEKHISGVCEGCGGILKAIETVDNAGHPTYWQGCEHCNSFRSGVEKRIFKIARQLVESGEMTAYHHMPKSNYEKSPELLEYFFSSQTAGLSRQISRIAALLADAGEDA